MKHSITYEYIADGKILVRTFTGSLSLREVATSMDDDIEKGTIHKGLIGIINHHVDTDINIEDGDMEFVVSVYKKHLDLLIDIKWATVIDFSMVALPALLKGKNPSFNVQSFTNFSSALRWVESES